MPALLANLRVWKASSYSPLALDLGGRQTGPVAVRGALRSRAGLSC